MSKDPEASIGKNKNLVTWLSVAAIIGFGCLVFFFLVKLVGKFWSAFNALDNSVAAAVVGGFFAVIASTITVMVARYYEEKRKRAELYREKKVQMYDEFINRLLTEFSGEELKVKIEKARGKKAEKDLGLFLRQKQKEFLLWSSAGVLREFSEWMKMLSQKHDANLLLQTEKFFLEIRKDLGHSNWRINQGDTIRLLLRDTDFFLDAIKTNPDITLSELAELEKNATGGEDKNA